VDDQADRLRELARRVPAPPCGTGLDARTDALVRLSALIATGADESAYVDAVQSALASGATRDEVVDTLVAVAATVGTARIVAASNSLSVALGYDIDGALEGYG
jgi:alkylhydroperoxidase/carboxymuconolactone decarboxylase family protein YurZ